MHEVAHFELCAARLILPPFVIAGPGLSLTEGCRLMARPRSTDYDGSLRKTD